MNLAEDIREKALFWSKSQIFDSATRQEIQKLLDSNDSNEITNRFYKDLEFGTGGMRGIMGAGLARFNIYNVRRASHALALYLKEIHGQKSIQVAVSYDSRMNSRLYAQTVCEVLAAYKIQTLLTSEMRPVPMLSFMVRHFKCDAGVCITASHNPAPYNGYKIYWASGGQLTSPHDKNILGYYTKLVDYSSLFFLDFNEAKNQAYVQEISDDLDSAYFEKLSSLSLFEGGRDLKIVYSPLHGTGVYAVPKALARFGFHNLSLVEEQSQPDGRFPTIASPNPEDLDALEMAMKLGRELHADIVHATDPDADRLAVVVREGEEWKIFSGNQMGALLFEYILSLSHKLKRLPAQGFTIKTIVTSDLLKKISEHYGVPCEDTLTGFKWICDLVENYESGSLKPYKHFICGAEESYGFLADSFVRDKDAVLSCVIASEMLAYYRSLGKNLSEVLDELYLRHGVYYERLDTITLPGKEGDEKIKSIMKNLRSKTPLFLGTEQIHSIKDYLAGYLKIRKERGFEIQDNLSLPQSDVLQFCCDSGIISIRPSGTEPKIKIYISVFRPSENLSKKDLPHIKHQLEKKAQDLLEFFSKFCS